MPGRPRGARAVLLGLMVVAGCSSPPSANGAVGDLRVGGDDSWNAGYERYAADAEHAGGHRPPRRRDRRLRWPATPSASTTSRSPLRR